MKDCFLVGPTIALTPVETENINNLGDMLSRWINDEAITYYMFTGQLPLSKAQIIKNLKKEISTNNVIFLIELIKIKKLVGYCGLYDIHKTARKAEFRILIGNKNFWGKGLGTEVAEMVTFFGFDRLNLHRIYLGYNAENKRAGKAYLKAGYVYEGTLRDDMYRNSKYYDSIKMSVLRDEYYKKYFVSHQKKFRAKSLQ